MANKNLKTLKMDFLRVFGVENAIRKLLFIQNIKKYIYKSLNTFKNHIVRTEYQIKYV